MSKTDTLHVQVNPSDKTKAKKTYNTKTLQALEDTKNGKNLSRSYISVDEMFEDLNK